MHIWVDADACPGVIKETLFRATARTGIHMTLVANRPLRVPREPQIKLLRVRAGFDVVDDEIVKRTAPGDWVVTGDIRLAAEVIGK